jgi:hypothetical protein
MPRRKKKTANEMTTEELARSVFPKKVVDEVKRPAHEKDPPEPAEEPDANSSRK